MVRPGVAGGSGVCRGSRSRRRSEGYTRRGADRPDQHDGEEVDAMDDTASSRHPSTPVVLRVQA
ncbi:hypothetical protein Cde04nite_28910 [Cellulomonas denverensis]|nr:hypothetical protein Cde04nite_28910 [Cellulomonas denverensis]